MKLLILALLSVEPNATPVPCGNAVCLGATQVPVTLGGTVQVNQGFWPDGGIARIIPVVPGATMSVSGIQVHNSSVPDVTLHSTVTRDSSVPIVSVKNKQVEVFAILGDGTVRAPAAPVSFATIDAGQEYVQNQLEVGGTTVLLGTLNASTVAEQVATLDAGQAYVQNQLEVGGQIVALSALNASSLPCDGGTPAPTATVRSGATCVCNRTTGAVCGVSSTTLTVHCVAGDTGPLTYLCF